MLCRLKRRISQEDFNSETDKMKAIKNMLANPEKVENAEVEINRLLSDKGTDKLKDNMGLIWDNQAYIQEKLSTLSDSANSKQRKYIKDLEKLGKALKKLIYDSLNIIENEKSRLLIIQEVLKNTIKKDDRNFKSILRELYTGGSGFNKGEGVISEESRESDFMSFEEDSQELKNVQNSFFMKRSKTDEDDFKSFHQPNMIKFNSSDNINHTDYNKPGKMKEDIIKEEKQEREHPNDSIVRLLRDNTVFRKYAVLEKPETRSQMPIFRNPNVKINVWEILKNNIGKDLSKITMPVYLNEPLSMLQKVAEYAEYKDCIRRANRSDDQYLRPALILSGFFISLSNTLNRIKKPFNPLLGETYEYIEDDLKILVEQVSHHPPISSFFMECDDFTMEGYFFIKINFSYKGFMANPIGDMKVYLKRTKEHYTLTRPKSTLHNYIIGKMYLWHSGDMIVENQTTGDKAIMYLKSKGWTSKTDYEAEGKVVDSEGQTHYNLYGKWNSFAVAIDIETQKEIKLIDKYKVPDDYDQQYYFCQFVIGLNHLTKKMARSLPPTDTRFRSDQRAYEYGDLKLAAVEKHRLEEGQRARRRAREARKEKYSPIWFDFEIEGKKVILNKYKGGYWEAREKKEWPKEMVQIYDCNN